MNANIKNTRNKNTSLTILIIAVITISTSVHAYHSANTSKNSTSKSFSSASVQNQKNSAIKFKTDTGTASAKFGKTYNSINEKMYAAQSSKASFQALKKVVPATSPTHFPVSDLKNYRSRYASNETLKRASQDSDIWGSRNRYYQSHPPVIVNGGSTSFGLLSGYFLASLLNNPSSAATYAFNHQNDSDYLKWRAEADQLSKDNIELKSQLAKLDAAKSANVNNQPDPNWLPEGVPISATLSDEALKSSQPDFNVCVGSEEGPYYKAAQEVLLPELNDWVNLNPIITKGSPEILEKIASGDCDAGFIQGDTTFDKTKMDVMFKPFLEVAHLACSINIKGKSISDLLGQSIWIPKSSGSRLTWDRFVKSNPDYDKITVNDAVNYEDAILKAAKGESCLFYMAAPHASSIDRLLNRKDLKLMVINDPLLLKDGAYEERALSSSDYGRTIQSSFFSESYIQTVASPATFVISSSWKASHAELSAKIALKLSNLETRLRRLVKQ